MDLWERIRDLALPLRQKVAMGFGKGVSHLHCGAFSKYILFAINFIVFLIGVIILITGIVGQVKKQEGIFQDFNEEGASNWFKHASVLILVTGLVIMLISALGCCGAIKESKCLLLTYSTIMLIFFIIVLVGSIMALVFKDKAVETLQKTAERTLKEYDPAKADLPSTKLWNKIQTEV
ncbi:unnamed protein product [Cyprideis torosa]|uniref:Uncharacterized protein n=1 Tax=Cyprideis torosa TaxID=163714 RepID=A0A7R8W4A4_9CRUS|nr:unnamed protein product [Cyprideis torosa]CAG0883989.1 unnamed protein product [Cyprideis torosa]